MGTIFFYDMYDHKLHFITLELEPTAEPLTLQGPVGMVSPLHSFSHPRLSSQQEEDNLAAAAISR